MLRVLAAGGVALILAGHAHAQDLPEPASGRPAQSVTDGELTAAAVCVNIVRSRSFEKGTHAASVVVLGTIQATSSATVYAAHQKVIIDEVLDQEGRSMLLPAASGDESHDKGGWVSDAYPFTDPETISGRVLPWWPVRGEVAIDADRARTVAAVSARFASTIATRLDVIDLRCAEIKPSKNMFPLVPGAHMSIPKLRIEGDGTTAIEYALWLHNQIVDPTTVSPVIRSDQQMRNFYEDAREYDLVGHDDREPPFLYSIELIDAEGRVVGTTGDSGSGRAHWTGHYWTSTDDVTPRSGAGRPEIVRIRMITETVRSEFPIDLKDLDSLEAGRDAGS